MHVQLYYSFSPLVVGHYQYLYSKYQLVVVTLFPFSYRNYLFVELHHNFLCSTNCRTTTQHCRNAKFSPRHS